MPGLRDLEQAQHWLERDLALKSGQDRIGRTATHSSLANVAFERFRDARDAGAPTEHVVAHLERARAGYQQALDLLPDDHHRYRAAVHGQLGNIHAEIGDVPRALGHYQQSIRYSEACGDTYVAGGTRVHIAVLLGENGRVGDALHYAHAALANFRQVGPGAAAMAGQAEALIQELEREAAH